VDSGKRSDITRQIVKAVDITSDNIARYGFNDFNAPFYDGTTLAGSGTDFSVSNLSGAN
jgi:hypothetical protein